MVSMKDIAKECGVSVASVSKALNSHRDIGQETRERILRTAEEMGYMANASARALKTSRSFNIGVLFVDPRQSGLAHEFFSSVLDSIRVESERSGYDITFINRYVTRNQTTYLKHCRYRGVDGVVIASVDFTDPMVLELIQSEIPTVTIDHVFNGRMAVLSDNVSGMETLTRHVIEKGHHNNKENTRGRIQLIAARTVAYIILIFLSILCLFSFYMLIINSTRSNAQLQAGFTMIPNDRFFVNLRNAWTDASINIPRGMLNSFFVAGANAILTTYFSALTAYGIHAYRFKLRRFAFYFILAVMMIPPQVSAVGFIQMMYKLNLTNNYLPLILPSIAAPVVFFYMKQYLDSVLPMEIVEASRMDGASEFYTFNHIVLPIMKPAIAVQMIFSFVSSRNNYFIPALLLNKAEMKTVPIMIAQLRSADYPKFDMGKVYMFILLAILPVMIVYIILSKSIIKGVTSGSVKG
ncbi:MAG: ABC transporter permease subunit [Clostridia bacterium]|nr:ABC transporter permease subunit [Clostridia bacterium]